MNQEAFAAALERYLGAREDFFWDAFLALSVNGITGDYAEFGSVGANSLSQAYAVVRQLDAGRHLWAFDSFEGFPDITHERDARWVSPYRHEGGVAAFHAECKRRGVPGAAYTAVPGYFDVTLGQRMASDEPRDIALAYVDCNLYTSSVTVLDFLAPRLKHGMIVAFDDYFLWTDREVSGERAALDEFLDAHPQWHFERYRDVHYTGVSFIVERADLLGRGNSWLRPLA